MGECYYCKEKLLEDEMWTICDLCKRELEEINKLRIEWASSREDMLKHLETQLAFANKVVATARDFIEATKGDSAQNRLRQALYEHDRSE